MWAFGALIPRMETTEARRTWDLLSGVAYQGNRFYLQTNLEALAKRLDPADAKGAGDGLIPLLEKGAPEVMFSGTVKQFAPKLSSAQARHIMAALIEVEAPPQALTLAALVPQLQQADIANLRDTLFAQMEDGATPAARTGWIMGLAALRRASTLDGATNIFR